VTGPEPPTSLDELAEAIARHFHAFYDRLAPAHGWTPQESARSKDFDQLPAANRALMVATVRGLLVAGVIEPGPTVLAPFRVGDA
jgi:hypothetical protein